VGWSVETVREYVTQPAQRATLDLPDGSRMVLGPDSRVVYSASASQGRVLELEGQAYFTVSADPTRPFVVKTRTVTTRVLGTAFSVRAYPTDRVAQVAVAEGKVAIGRTEPSTVLLPGDVGVVEQGLEPIVRRDVQLRDVFGWMHGQLRFDGTPFREVALELERTYGLTIQVTDSTLMDRRMTGVLSNEQVADVLELVGVGIDATYTRRGSVVVFTPR
jgi:transmembrane sensor